MNAVERIDYTHKKQTGGSGQFAKVQIAIEPASGTAEGEGGYEFVNAVTGGRIPREYIPSVDAGCQEAMENGALADYPMVDIQASRSRTAPTTTLTPRASRSRSPARWRSRRAHEGGPVLLEPMMAVEVTTPEDFMGDVIGDLNSRRGQIQAMEERAGARVVRALVPLSEMFGYVGDLRSKTQAALPCSSTRTPRFRTTWRSRSSRRRAASSTRRAPRGDRPRQRESRPHDQQHQLHQDN